MAEVEASGMLRNDASAGLAGIPSVTSEDAQQHDAQAESERTRSAPEPPSPAQDVGDATSNTLGDVLGGQEIPKLISRKAIGACKQKPEAIDTYTEIQQDTAQRSHLRISSAGSQTFTHPQTTIIELISTSATASAFPESFGLTISQKGLWIAAYTSTALYIIESEKLPATSGRFFRLRRKPLGMAVCDDPQVLAILSNSHSVDVYTSESASGTEAVWNNLQQRSFIFGHEISTIALSPDGKIMAAGYRGGIEIVSVAPDAPENHRRQISCEPMAEIVFSEDGRSLLATSLARKTRPSTVMSVGHGMDGPISEDGVMESLPASQAWISQLLFPERTPYARQAAMISDPTTGQVNDLFAFDGDKDSWGVYDLTMKRFTSYRLDVFNLMPSTRKMEYESALPAVASDYSQIAIAVKHDNRTELLIYTVPYSWRADSPVSASPNTQSKDALQPLHNVSILKTGGAAAESVTKLRWTARNGGQSRLLALASTSVRSMEETVGEMTPAAAGRIVIVNFGDNVDGSSEPEKVTINFDALPEEVLGQQHMDFDREVSLLRARSQVVRRGSGNSNRIRRSSTTHGLSRSSGLLSPSDVSEASLNRRHSVSSLTSDETDQSHGALVLDEPYAQGQPRSQFSLQRAATISAQSGASRRHLRALPDRPLEYRRADGFRYVPYEQDAENWVPPPPPYSRTADTGGAQRLDISKALPEQPRREADEPNDAPESSRRRRGRPENITVLPHNAYPSHQPSSSQDIAARSPHLQPTVHTPRSVTSGPQASSRTHLLAPGQIDTSVQVPPSPRHRPSPGETTPAQMAYMHHHNTFPPPQILDPSPTESMAPPQAFVHSRSATPINIGTLPQVPLAQQQAQQHPPPQTLPRQGQPAELLKTLPPLPPEARHVKRLTRRFGGRGTPSQSLLDVSVLAGAEPGQQQQPQQYQDRDNAREVDPRNGKKKGTKCVVM